ncbi:Holliday junction resolvase [Candidatus Cyrtobacter comes]|uniref:Holliday junction resolvase n=1 Tax=Candidatus Cyrtobacter comes TaxID=675776 RepID=A0ABU5L8R9_9RICK|nr:Holliday junction resolvase RuvX [Candidatus Cyrtobacter comes]MDZ5762320.1 Holliday junction resolvase [Candidatus Cyrtobacter comes]
MDLFYPNEREKLIKYIRENHPCKIAALDIGRKKVGFAICNTLVKASVARVSFVNCSLNSISQKLKEENIKALIIGISMMGEEIIESALYIKNCAKKICTNLNIPGLLVNEAFTTTIADSILRLEGMNRRERNQKDDSIAALIMLDEFLEKL